MNVTAAMHAPKDQGSPAEARKAVTGTAQKDTNASCTFVSGFLARTTSKRLESARQVSCYVTAMLPLSCAYFLPDRVRTES